MSANVYSWLQQGMTFVPNVLLNYYPQLNLTNSEMVLVIFLLHKMGKKRHVSDVAEISRQIGWSMDETMEQLDGLMTKEYLSIDLVTNSEGKQVEHLSLEPLFEHIDTLLNPQIIETPRIPSRSNLVNMFEKEFGRVLTALELNQINQWQQIGYAEELILYALQQATIRQALNVNYIDKILLNWTQQNRLTPQEVQATQWQQQTQQHNQYNHFGDVKVPLYDMNGNSLL